MKNSEIADVVTQGPSLAFIVYPEALALMDVEWLFSFLFFFMLCLLAVSSLCGSMEAIVAAIFDEFPSLKGALRRDVTKKRTAAKMTVAIKCKDIIKLLMYLYYSSTILQVSGPW